MGLIGLLHWAFSESAPLDQGRLTSPLSHQCLVTRETLCLGRVNVPSLLRHSSKGKDALKMCIQVVEFVT
jgi:hypothetical protein